MNKEEKEAIDILENCIADYVIEDFCCGKYCPDEDMCKEKDCPYETAIEIVVNLIQKQEKIIDKMAEKLVEDTEWFYSEFDNYTKQDFIEYFKKEVEKDG